MSLNDPRLPARLAIAACAFFFLAAQPFLPLLGIQNDEAIFMASFLEPRGGTIARIGAVRLPVMLVSYTGALKAWVYRPIFAVFAPNAWSLREPAVLAGAASLWLFFLFLRRIAGKRAAVIGCGLLAVDAVYLLTLSFDWGPVALQHLLLIGALLALVRFHQEGDHRALAGGFFLLGLAMWDKALAIWMLSGMGLAALALFRRQIARLVTKRRLAIAVLGFGLGALPLIAYNATHRFDTFRGQTYDASEIPQKAGILLNTIRGDGLFGWLVNEDWQTASPHAPRAAIEKASSAASELAGKPRLSLLLYAFVLALLVAPLARGGELRAILFALIVMAVQWIQMAITVGAGASLHHTILLWPLPQLAAGVSFAAASRRIGRAGLPVAAAILAVSMASGALQINEYYRHAWRNGGSASWTEAIYPLARYAAGAKASAIYGVDWGILDSLRLIGEGQLPLDPVFGAISPDLEAGDLPRVMKALADPNALFLTHSTQFEFFAGRNEKLIKIAGTAGYRSDMVASFSDSFGRPIFEAYRFARRD